MSFLLRAREIAKLANGGEEAEGEETEVTKGKKIPREVIVQFFKENPNPDDEKVHELAEAYGTDPHTLETQIYGILTEKMGQTKTAAFFNELEKIGQELGEEGEEDEGSAVAGLDEEEDAGPFVGDIEKMTEENPYFRRVLHTGQFAQLVLMTLQVGEALPEEVHPDIDQFFRIEEGEAVFVLDGVEHELGPGGAVVIPAGTRHEVINSSEDEPLKVYTVYSPPKHPAGTLDETKADADQRESANVPQA